MLSSLNLLVACFLALHEVKSENNIRLPLKLAKEHEKQNRNTPDRAIIGGQETIPGRYPYIAGLLPSSSSSPICGGSLIAEQWVLSAAHCYPDIGFIDIGRHNRFNISESYEMIEVDFMVVHPDYNSFTLENDVLLIRLKEPSKITPVSLISASDNVPPGSKTTVMGWGVTELNEPSEILLEVEVDIVSNDDCNSSYSGGITNDMVCAASPGKDSCQGDSGGPLFKKGENATTDEQVGIVSWGFGCADPSFPGVYSSILSGLDYIEKMLSCNVTDLSDDCCKADCVNGTYVCASTTCQYCDSFPNDGFDYSNCNVNFPCYVRDYYCDIDGDYNTAECNYDGGDCCEDTCIFGQFCGPCYDCKDPNSELTGDTDFGNAAFQYFTTLVGATLDLLLGI